MTETSARVIAHSAHPSGGPDLITVEVTLHRFVLAELNTHRAFSRNSASSRAVPVEKTLRHVSMSPAFPLSLPAEQPGMQGGEELSGEARADAEDLLRRIHAYTVHAVTDYVERHPDKATRLHKSVLNRPLEWFSWHKVIITATEWDNFFALRCHPLAQPEIRAAAELVQDAVRSSRPIRRTGRYDWHTPYATAEHMCDRLVESVARCAWVSTASHDGDHSHAACVKMVRRLASANPMHASPFEHQAAPTVGNQPPGNLRGWRQLRHSIERRGLAELGLEP